MQPMATMVWQWMRHAAEKKAGKDDSGQVQTDDLT